MSESESNDGVDVPDTIVREVQKRVFQLVKENGGMSTDDLIDELEDEYDIRTMGEISDIMRRFRYNPNAPSIKWECGEWRVEKQ